MQKDDSWNRPQTLEEAREEKNTMIQELFSDPSAFATKTVMKNNSTGGVAYGYGDAGPSPPNRKSKKTKSFKMTKTPRVKSLEKRKRSLKKRCPEGCVPERFCNQGRKKTSGEKAEGSLLQDLIRRAEAADKLQKYNPETGDYDDIDPSNPASALFPDRDDDDDDGDDLFFDAPKKTTARPNPPPPPPPPRPKSPSATKSPRSGVVPSQFQQFLAARKNADASGDGTFSWNGNKYVKGTWSNGTPVWKKAANFPVVQASLGLPTMDSNLPIVNPTMSYPQLMPIDAGTKIPKGTPKAKAQVMPQLTPIG